MDRNTLLAISLILIVLILPSLIFTSPPPPPPLPLPLPLPPVETTDVASADSVEGPNVGDVTRVLPVAPPVSNELPTPELVAPDTPAEEPVVVVSRLYR